MTIAQIHQLFLDSNGVCTDTRKATKNTLFFALKGENFNGNIYAKQAIESGASYALIDDPSFKTSDRYIVVNDVLKTLQDVASYHREYLGIPILALTGSNGKTTTKELINCVLSASMKTTATIGNLNNHIGVPLTLLSMTKETQIGIVEMGANHQGEIDLLCSIAKPDYGYITNIGKAHLEGFGGIEGVLKGKTELYRHLKKNNKKVILNLDDEKLVNASRGMDIYSFSQSDKSEVTIKLLDTSPTLQVSYKDTVITSNLIGVYNFTNIAAAIAIGSYFDIDVNAIKMAIESYTPTNNRSQVIKKGSYTIILDAYNANPTSMAAAIENFEQFEHTTKIAFLGDMFELGNEAATEHQKITDKIGTTNVHQTYLIGGNFYKTQVNDPRIKQYESYESLAELLTIEDKNVAILIKGSRGMKLERILDLL